MENKILKSVAEFLMLCACILLQTNAIAQTENLLYGVTATGGPDGTGVIFHFDRNNGNQAVDYSPPKLIDGRAPAYQRLLPGGNGKFYGMTSSGGTFSRGVIFEWDTLSNTYTKKINFNGIFNGAEPTGSLAMNEGKVYGMTSNGGANDLGIIFEWDPATNICIKKIDFDGTSKGNTPFGSLAFYNGNFYGMTSGGGENSAGVIFEWNPVTNIFLKKIDFSSSKGLSPYGTLTLKNNKFYGMTTTGGGADKGVIFEWDPATNEYNKKVEFDGADKGAYPYNDLKLNVNKFYGMTSEGGSNNLGVIFEWDPSTNVFIKKMNFTGADNGSMPHGNLATYNGKFYGMTYKGGAYGLGVIFEWDPVTNICSKKMDFDGVSSGSNPYGSLAYGNGKFFGTTFTGGLYQHGILFEWDPVSNSFTKKIDLGGILIGGAFYGSLVSYGGRFYGMTYDGGEYGLGVIFVWDPATNMYTRKIDFDGALKGSQPYFGHLAMYNDRFYGMTTAGGTHNMGVLFEWDPFTNEFSKKIDFESSIGTHPYGSLTFYNGLFYGMTSEGGMNGIGVIFSWDPLTDVYTKKVDFDWVAKGSMPYGDLTMSNGKFYGMTQNGGINGCQCGVIFEWDPSTNIFTKKMDFDHAETGGNPQGSLVLHEGKFYGMTIWGGLYGKGVIFEWDPVIDIFIKKVEFDGSVNGDAPYGDLTYAGDKFYGMTAQGGLSNVGVIFEWDPETNVFMKLFNFTGNNGAYPQGKLIANSPCTIFTSSIPANGGTTTGNGTFTFGSSVVVDASPNEGWSFYQWTQNCSPVSSDASYSFIVTTDIDLTAIFYQPGQQFVITSAARPLEGGYTTGCGAYYADSLVTVSSIATPGWELINWTENGAIVSTSPDYSFYSENHRNLVANFDRILGVDTPEEIHVKIFPNPTGSVLFIQGPEDTRNHIEKIDLINFMGTGIFTYQSTSFSNLIRLDLSPYENGIYFLRVRLTDGTDYVRKVIIKK